MASLTFFIDGQKIAKTMIVKCKVINMKKVGMRLRAGTYLLNFAAKVGGFKIDVTIIPPGLKVFDK